jgi:hypothetical protein
MFRGEEAPMSDDSDAFVYMENDYEHLKTCIGHKGLFGTEISQAELIEIISRYPSTLWLDLFSKIEGFLLIPRGKDFDEHLFLADNLLCPSALERTKRKANTGSVFFTLGQLNLLRKLAIIYGNDSNQTEIEKVDISKALLGAQDIHNEYDEVVGQTSEFEIFCKFVVRNGYLNNHTDSATLFFRAKKIYVEQSNKLPIYPNKSFREFFNEKVGLAPEEAIALNFALVTPFFQKKEKLFGQTVTLPTNYFGQTTISSDLINSIVDSMAVDFASVKKDFADELSGKELTTLPVGYDLTIFRKTPLIRLSDGRLICANLSCLLEKSTQNLIWMTTRGITGVEGKQLINHLTHYRGLLFEEYLKELCTIMVERNKSLFFTHIPPEATTDNEEVGDAILIQGNKLVIFEAKSRQFLEPFKTTGNLEKYSDFIKEFIKAAQQIEIAARKIRSGAVSVGGLNIDPTQIGKIYPVVVTYESVPMHAKMQRFIRQKVSDAGYLSDPIFAPLEVVTIGDIEQTIDIVDTLTPIELLDKKNSDNSHASESNFHNFLSRYCAINTVICNGWQRNEVEKMWKDVFHPFFDDKFR